MGIRKKLAKLLEAINPNTAVEENKEYGLSDLNWKDDGDALQDPSMNDYLKGYQMEPYAFQQYAKKNELYKVKSGDSLGGISVVLNKELSKLYKLNGFSQEKVSPSKHLKVGSFIIVDKVDNEKEKLAAKEIIDITYTPENLAKEILTIWSQVDGPLQNFFDGFTMNKMDNKMKQEIAEHLKDWGYDVVPTFTQDTPIYASAYKSFKKIAETKDADKILNYFKQVFPDSYALELLKGEVADLMEEKSIKVTTAQAGGLVDYYKQIFPEDYAISLVNVALDKPDVSFDEFQDYQISDESLVQMEKMDSGNQNPTSDKPNSGGMGGYDFTTHMRSDNGFPAGNYEVRAKNVKKK